MANGRNIGLFFKVSEHEHDLIKQKIALFGTKIRAHIFARWLLTAM
jgi:hypothetical protein